MGAGGVASAPKVSGRSLPAAVASRDRGVGVGHLFVLRDASASPRMLEAAQLTYVAQSAIISTGSPPSPPQCPRRAFLLISHRLVLVLVT